MRNRAIAALVGTALLASGACRPPAPESSRRDSSSPDGRTRALLEQLASAIVARDYPAAYGTVATERQASLGLAEFEEAFRHYRDGLPDGLAVKVSVDPYDRESATLVPEELRDRIVAEGAVEFVPDDEELEGFTANVWIMMEGGEPRLATFFVGD